MRVRAWYYWRMADAPDNDAARGELIRLAERYEGAATERGAPGPSSARPTRPDPLIERGPCYQPGLQRAPPTTPCEAHLTQLLCNQTQSQDVEGLYKP